jgi:hypothetical protein
MQFDLPARGFHAELVEGPVLAVAGGNEDQNNL